MSRNEYLHFNKFLYEQNNSTFNNANNFPENKKNETMQENKIDENIFLIKNDIYLKNDVQIQTNSQVDGILLTFMLTGNHTYKSLLTDYKLQTQDNTTNISLINKEEGIENFQKEMDIKSLHIIVKKDFLIQNFPVNKKSDKIFKALENKNCHISLKNSSTNFKIEFLVKEIYNSVFMGNLEKISLHAKILEILYEEFTNLFQENSSEKKNKIKFSDYDINAIYLAKDILINNIKNPPSILELAKIVKLNEFKLKIGFKNVFNTSPYRYLHEYKMQKAKSLLKQSDMNVGEISNEIGYKYIHSFSKVFSQRFGILPKDLMKNRKYYY